MKIRITENQYTNLVEQYSLKDFKDLVKYWKNIDWETGNGSSSPNITPLPTSIMYTDKEGSINSHYNKNRWGRKHHGVDLDTTGDVKNQPVVATCHGKVRRRVCKVL